MRRSVLHQLSFYTKIVAYILGKLKPNKKNFLNVIDGLKSFLEFAIFFKFNLFSRIKHVEKFVTSENINSLESPLGPNKTNSPKEKVMQTFGFVLGIHPQAQTNFPFIYTTASFSPGFSGGPVVNKKNHVIGIATVEGRSINLALPINFIKPFFYCWNSI